MDFDFKNEAEETVIFFTNHLDKLRKFKNVSKITQDFISKLAIEVELEDLTSIDELIDLSALITISQLDLITANKALFFSTSDWEKIYFIKNIYLTIYESLKTYKKYEKFLFDITSNSPKLKLKLDEIASEIKEFRRNYKYSTHIDFIRNNISGHINKDFELYYDTIIDFNGDDAAKMCVNFFKIIQELQNFSTDILIPILDSKELNLK